MATTAFGVNHPLAVKVWSKKLYREALKATWAQKFMGTNSNSLCHIKEDLSKGAGDRVRCGLRMLLSGDGVEGDGTLEGNEEALVHYHDDIVINQLRHAVRSEGKMSEQRVPYSVRDEARSGLTDWWAERIDDAFFNHLCGVSTASSVKTAHNTPTDPIAATDTDHYILAGDGTLTTEAQVASASASNAMSLTYIDWAVERAKTISPMIRPLRINGEDKYVMFLHTYQVTDLRTSTSTGQWLDIQKAAMQGGQVSNNPIYTGALGEYNGVVLHESTRVKSVTANVYRAVLCGAQAMVAAYGQNSGSGERMSWVEELFDYKNQLGVSAGMIWGMKAARYNSKDFAKIIVPTYAEAHG